MISPDASTRDKSSRSALLQCLAKRMVVAERRKVGVMACRIAEAVVFGKGRHDRLVGRHPQSRSLRRIRWGSGRRERQRAREVVLVNG